MAQTLVKNERVGTYLLALNAEVDDLPQLEEEWGKLDKEQRVLVALDWEHLFGDYLTDLNETYNRGEMTEAETSAYRRLTARLQENQPLLARLGLPQPQVQLFV